eukprot:116417_1
MASPYSALGANKSNDPYYSQKNGIQQSVERFTTDFDTWHDMLENTNTHQNQKFKQLTDSLKAQYKQINRSLKELSKANNSASNAISSQELNERKSFVKDMKTVITECRGTMQSDKTRDIIQQHKEEKAKAMKENPQQRFSRMRNDESIADHKEVQRQEYKEQDVILTDMHDTLKRLGVHANTINVEIESQTQLLDEVDEEMTITGDRLSRLTNKLDTLMGHSNTKKILLIVILVIILIVLIYFMF